MSYRSIKRVLGETSLERKCRFLFGVCLCADHRQLLVVRQPDRGLVYEQNRNTGRLLVDQADGRSGTGRGLRPGTAATVPHGR